MEISRDMNIFEFLASISLFRFLVIVLVTGQVIIWTVQIIAEVVKKLIH